MKKFLLYVGIGLLVILLLFGSCSNDTDTSDDITPTNNATESVISTPTPTISATPEPTPTPTQKPTVAPTVKPENKTEMVWITKSGKKYHSHSGCSNMKAPNQVTKENAINGGRGPCSKCY